MSLQISVLSLPLDRDESTCMVTAEISLSLLTDRHLIHSDLLILSLNMGITTFDQGGK